MSGWNISPVDEIIQDTLELTDGLEVDANVLKTINGGISDDFNTTLDTTKWVVNNNNQGMTANGELYFSVGGGDGNYKRYVGSKQLFSQTNVWKNASAVIAIRVSDYVRSHQITLAPSIGDTSSNSYPKFILVTNNAGTIGNTYFHAIGNGVNTAVSVTLATGDMFYFRFKMNTNVAEDTYTGVSLQYAINNTTNWIDTGVVGIFASNLWLDSYWDNTNGSIRIEKVYTENLGYPTSETATLPETEAYTALSPAKLASVDTITPHISTAGAGGTINLHVQHKSDEDVDWVDLSGNLNSWSDLGSIDGTAITVPEYFSRTSDKFRYKLVYSGTGLVSYPEIDKLTFTWSSDVSAPSEPTVTSAISASESILVLLFGSISSDAYAIELEININGAGSLPISKRNKIESGYGNLRLIGNSTEEEREGERNTLLYSVNGLQKDDVVVITAYQVDRVGNRSAGKQKSVTMTGAQYLTMLTTILNENISTTKVVDKVECK